MLQKILLFIFGAVIILTSFSIMMLLIYIFKFLKIHPIVKAKQYSKLNNNAKKQKIVFLGDSLTELYKVHDFFHNKYIYNRGISNDTTDGVINRLYSNVIVLEPSKIFLQIGTNDFRKHRKKEQIYNNIVRIIEELKTTLPETKIHVISLYPVNHHAYVFSLFFTAFRSNKAIIYINNCLKEYCEKENITYIDVHSHLTDKNGCLKKEYTIEGLHINDDGYFVITDVLDDYVFN